MHTAELHSTSAFGGSRSGLSTFQRLIVLRSHPLSVICDTIGLMWATYLLWHRQWQLALAIGVAARAVGFALVRGANVDAMARTTMGKMMLLHLRPFNLATQTVGALLTVWGVWEHATPIILAGLSLIVAAHAVGWTKVHPSLETA
jgi:hypothetical protein